MVRALYSTVCMSVTSEEEALGNQSSQTRIFRSVPNKEVRLNEAQTSGLRFQK